MPEDQQSPQFDQRKDLLFEILIANIFTDLIGLSSDDVDRGIESNLQKVVELLRLDRTSLWQWNEDKKEFSLTHTWAAPGILPFPRNSRYSHRDYPWVTQQLLGGETVQFSNLNELPDEASVDKKSLQITGPKANVTVPLFAGGRIFGMLAFGSFTEREWPEALARKLQLVGQIFAGVLVRIGIERKLQLALSELRNLKERLQHENIYLQEEIKSIHKSGRMIGQSESLRQVLNSIDQVARTDSTVLLVGETGTGKEMAAVAIHERSLRNKRAMVRVNCAAIPAPLLESELFGREKGAYTGALSKQIGRFELANESTIFLDEVGEFPPDVQVKLLRVLQEREFERLGSPKPVQVDVRVIAATNHDLEKDVREGRFRQDLFYRLNVFPISIPPLRRRKEDIPLLVWNFVDEFSASFGKSIGNIPNELMNALSNYSWPGNIRELRNIIERGMIVSDGPELRLNVSGFTDDNSHAELALEVIERNHILKVLEMSGWRIRGRNGAAGLLQMKPTTLEGRMTT